MTVPCLAFARSTRFQAGVDSCGIYCLLFVATGTCLSQEPIQVKVKLVNVAFSARDSRGALIQNLSKDDGEVFEDAVPQKVSFFVRSVNVPLTPLTQSITRMPYLLRSEFAIFFSPCNEWCTRGHWRMGRLPACTSGRASSMWAAARIPAARSN